MHAHASERLMTVFMKEKIWKKKFISLEGVNGTGKTSICDIFKNKPNFISLKSPPPPFDKIKQKVLDNISPNSRLFYFLASNIEISNIIKNNIDNYNVILDRYLFSTLAYHMSLEKIHIRNLEDIIIFIKKYLMFPDVIVFLKVNRKEQLKRCKYKNDYELQKKIYLNDKFQISLLNNYKLLFEHFSCNVITIDTSSKTIKEVAEEIYDLY